MWDIPALSRATDALPNGDWTHDIVALSTKGAITLSRSASKFAQDKIKTSLDRGHAGRAFNWAFLLIHLTKGETLNDSRFCELFRPTRQETQLTKLSGVLNRLADQARTSKLLEASDTFASWASFSRFFVEALKVERAVLEAIRSTDRALAWLLSYVEEVFAFELELAHLPTIDKQHRFDLSKEEAAAAVSYLLGRYYHRWGFSTRDFQILHQPTRPPDKIAEFLLRGYALVEIRSLEPALFRFGSRCSWTNKTVIEISHPNDTIDISLELGYIKTQHSAKGALNILSDNRPKFNDICERFRQDLSPKIVTYASSGPPRLRIEMPESVARILSEKIILAPGFYAEEVRELSSLCWELSTTIDELETFRVTQNLTLINLLQIGRLFRLLASARNEHLAAMRENDPVCYWNSMLGASPSKDELVRMLSVAGIPEQIAEEYVGVHAWRPQDDTRPLDVQYTSFLPFGNKLAVPFNLHAKSNSMRNALILQGKRFYEDGTVDPLSTNLQRVLAERTPHTRIGLNYKWQGLQSDVDVLALIDDCVYAFECKNTLLPCSAFERRTLWDHLLKAVDQLDQLRDLWPSLDFRAYLAKKLGWPISAATKLATCIVPSVRLYSGAFLQGHPVRHSRELVNFIGRARGALSTVSGEIIELDIRRGSEFSGAALDEYLSKSCELYQAHWKSMTLQWEEFHIGSFIAKNRRYRLDVVALEDELRTRGFVVPARDEPPELAK